MDDLTPDASCSIIWTERSSLPSTTTLTAIYNDPHCHLQRPSLPSATTLIAICNDPRRHLQRPSLPSTTTLTAICNDPHFYLQPPSLLSATTLAAICNDPHCLLQRPSLPSARALVAICKGIYQYWLGLCCLVKAQNHMQNNVSILALRQPHNTESQCLATLAKP